MPDRPNILIVAPPDTFTAALAARLEVEGAQVTQAHTASEALAAKQSGFELILLDLELPESDGLAVLRQMYSNGNANGASGVAVLLLKGEGEPAHIVQRGFDFGASGYLIKHRLPHDLSSARILDDLVKAVATTGGRRDACPFSARHEFGRCSAFLPLSIASSEEDGEPMISCSHLRIGTSDTWRLYPRCAIGDQPARDRYLADRTPV